MVRDGLRRYLTGSVPISIGLHLFALFLFFVIPLTANIVLPMVTVELPEYVQLAPMPPPPAVAPPSARRAIAPEPPAPVAPTTAPLTISKAPDVLPEYGPTRSVDTVSGIAPSGDGSIGFGVEAPRVLVSPPPQKAGPVRVADLPVAPRKVVDVRPVYPDIARMAQKEGTVVMEAVLDPTGRVTQLRVIQSVPLLDQAAIDAVRQWRYTPSTLGGHPVSVLMSITITFKLQ